MASDAGQAQRQARTRDWLPPTLLGVFVFIWLWAAWEPLDRQDWLLENLLVFLSVPALLITYRWHRFSDLSYCFLFTFISLHVVGSHWTYSSVPYQELTFLPGWMREGRNGYDRFVHFMYGLLLFVPAREVIARVTGRTGFSASYFAVEFMVATSALYEIVEWVTALIVAPGLADKFLGQQGDQFDAVADMALAGLGALITMGLYEWRRRAAGRRVSA